MADRDQTSKAPKVRGRGADDSGASPGSTGPKGKRPNKPKRQRKFRTVARGYSREQVDKSLQDMDAELDRAAAIIVQKDKELEVARQAETEAVDRAFFYIMDLKERLLSNAEIRAEQIISEAQTQVNGGKSDGSSDAIIKAAKAEAARIVNAARAEAQRLETFGPSAGSSPAEPTPIRMG
ncbi:MAG: hypothetical protein HKO10_10010, partial [Acidimicrobiia bacterium]|nr:hypothetical protein [Acidimicrobiia bacterium]